MPLGEYLLGGLLGLAFGAAVSFGSSVITRRSLQKNKTAAVMGASFLRQLLDFLAFLVVFLLRKVLPFSFYAVIIGTAVGLSAGSILMAIRTGKQAERSEKGNGPEL